MLYGNSNGKVYCFKKKYNQAVVAILLYMDPVAFIQNDLAQLESIQSRISIGFLDSVTAVSRHLESSAMV